MNPLSRALPVAANYTRNLGKITSGRINSIVNTQPHLQSSARIVDTVRTVIPILKTQQESIVSSRPINTRSFSTFDSLIRSSELTPTHSTSIANKPRFTSEQIENLEHFDAVVDQSAAILGISPKSLIKNISSKSPEIPKGAIIRPDGIGSSPLTNLAAGKKKFLEDLKEVRTLFAQAVPNQPKLEENARVKLSEFITKYGGKTDNFDDKSLPQLKAFINTQFRGVLEKKESGSAWEYGKNYAKYTAHSLKAPFIDTILKAVFSSAVLLAGAATLKNSGLFKTDEEKLKDAVDEANKTIEDYNTTVKSRKASEEQLRAIQQLNDSYSKHENAVANHKTELVHLCEKLDEFYPLNRSPEQTSKLKASVLKRNTAAKGLETSISENKEILNEITKLLSNNPGLKEKYVNEITKQAMLLNEKSTHNILGRETEEFSRAKKQALLDLDALCESIPDASEVFSKYPEPVITSFKDKLEITESMIDETKKYSRIAQSEQEIDKKTQQEIVAVGDPSKLISSLKAHSVALSASGTKVGEFETKLKELGSQTSELKQLITSELKRQSETEHKIADGQEETLQLVRHERNIVFFQSILPALNKDIVGAMTDVQELGKEVEYLALEKDYLDKLQSDPIEQKKIASFFKVKSFNDVNEDMRNAYIQMVASNLAARDIKQKFSVDRYIADESKILNEIQKGSLDQKKISDRFKAILSGLNKLL